MFCHVTKWFRRIYGDSISQHDFHCLLTPATHSSLLARRRSEMMISRVRLVAMLFAILTPLWVVVDAFFLPWPLWGWISIQRVAVSIAFWILVKAYPHSSQIQDAYRALALLFCIPSLFFLSSNLTLSGYWVVEMTNNPAIVGYTFLPFVMLAGLSIFPLTFLEGILFAAPALIAQVLFIVFDLGTLMNNSGDRLATSWLLALISGVATLAGMSQLHLMRQLNRQASHDPLTQCFNRASGEELLTIHFHISLRHQRPMSLVFIDLDHFKSVNDQYGHEAGDLVLRQAATRLREAIRTEDMLIRWGGEEFLILAPDTPIEGALHLVKRLRERGFGLRPDGSPITASIGIAERELDDSKEVHALVELADHRMYLAKKGGRDTYIYES